MEKHDYAHYVAILRDPLGSEDETESRIWILGIYFTSGTNTDDVKQKNNHETVPSRFFPEQKTNRSFVLCHLCPVHKVLTGF